MIQQEQRIPSLTGGSEVTVEGEMLVPTREGMRYLDSMTELLSVHSVERATRIITGSSDAAIIAKELRGRHDTGGLGDFWVYKSYKDLADEAGFYTKSGNPATATVKRALEKLIARGLVQRDVYFYRDGEWEYCYRLNLWTYLEFVAPAVAVKLPKELLHLESKVSERAKKAANRARPPVSNPTHPVSNPNTYINDSVTPQGKDIGKKEETEEKDLFGEPKAPDGGVLGDIRMSPTGDAVRAEGDPDNGSPSTALPGNADEGASLSTALQRECSPTSVTDAREQDDPALRVSAGSAGASPSAPLPEQEEEEEERKECETVKEQTARPSSSNGGKHRLSPELIRELVAGAVTAMSATVQEQATSPPDSNGDGVRLDKGAGVPRHVEQRDLGELDAMLGEWIRRGECGLYEDPEELAGDLAFSGLSWRPCRGDVEASLDRVRGWKGVMDAT